MNALGGRLLYVCCLLMINFGPSFRATSSVFYQCSFEQKSRTKCVHHIVQQEKKKNGNRSSTVQQQLSDSHSGPRRNIWENIVEKFITEWQTVPSSDLFSLLFALFHCLLITVQARMYLQLPLQQWGAGNVYLLVLSSWKVNIAENPNAVMGL